MTTTRSARPSRASINAATAPSDRPSAYLKKYGYHPRDFYDEIARREKIAMAVADLARAAYDGNTTAAAKRTAKHIGHIASYLTHSNPQTSQRLRSNQHWLKETYYPPTTKLARAVDLGRRAIRHAPRAGVHVLDVAHTITSRSGGALGTIGTHAAKQLLRHQIVNPLLLKYEKAYDQYWNNAPSEEAIKTGREWQRDMYDDEERRMYRALVLKNLKKAG